MVHESEESGSKGSRSKQPMDQGGTKPDKIIGSGEAISQDLHDFFPTTRLIPEDFIAYDPGKSKGVMMSVRVDEDQQRLIDRAIQLLRSAQGGPGTRSDYIRTAIMMFTRELMNLKV